MSLIAWYPLNGDLKNYGIEDMELTEISSPTFSNDGKIGKGLSNGGNTQWTAAQTAKILNNNALSICFWIKVLNATTNNIIFGTEAMSPPNNRKFSIFQYPTVNDLHLSWQNDSSDPFISCKATGVFPTGKWVHCAITYRNPTVTIYINGSKYNEYSGVSNSSSFSYITTVTKSNPSRIMNDYRFYDHCLSPKEVKEISKAKILHYPMNQIDGVIGGRNLFYVQSMASPWTTLIDSDGYANYNCVRSGATSNSWNRIVSPFYTRVQAINNITVTFELKVDDVNALDHKCVCAFQGWASNKTTRLSWFEPSIIDTNCFKLSEPLSNGKWIKVKWVVTNGATVFNGGVSGYSATDIAYINITWQLVKNGSIHVRKIKIEDGTSSTPWTSALEDFSAMKDNIIYDVSGYGNNGTVTDGSCPTWSADCVVGQGSYQFNGTNFIKSNLTKSIDQLTCSFWYKPSASNGNYAIIASNYSSPTTGFWIAGNTEGSGLWFYDGNYCKGSFSLSNNTWYHGCFIFNQGTGKFYVNGVLKCTSTLKSSALNISNLSIGNSYTGTTWNTKQYGNIQDFRVYATVLSDADIKELYETRFSLANNGTMFCSEYVEDNEILNVSFGSNGLLKSNELTEDYANKQFKLYKNSVVTNEIIEN